MLRDPENSSIVVCTPPNLVACPENPTHIALEVENIPTFPYPSSRISHRRSYRKNQERERGEREREESLATYPSIGIQSSFLVPETRRCPEHKYIHIKDTRGRRHVERIYFLFFDILQREESRLKNRESKGLKD